MSNSLEGKLSVVKRKSWWPVTSLARILGKPPNFIYRHVDNGDFDAIKDGGPLKIVSESVVKYFAEGRR